VPWVCKTRLHGIDASEKVVVRKQLRRSQVLAFLKAADRVREPDAEVDHAGSPAGT